jgi:hypothetical protein
MSLGLRDSKLGVLVLDSSQAMMESAQLLAAFHREGQRSAMAVMLKMSARSFVDSAGLIEDVSFWRSTTQRLMTSSWDLSRENRKKLISFVQDWTLIP